MHEHRHDDYVGNLEEKLYKTKDELDSYKMLVHHYRRQLKMVQKASYAEIIDSLNQDFYGLHLDYGIIYYPSDFISGDYIKLFKFEDSYILLFCDASGHGADSQGVSSKLVHYVETNYENYKYLFKEVSLNHADYNQRFNTNISLFHDYIKKVSIDMANLLDKFGDEYFVASLFVFIQKVNDEYHLFFINRGTLWPIIYRKIFNNLEHIYDYNNGEPGVRAGDLIGSSFLREERRKIVRKKLEQNLIKQNLLTLSEKEIQQKVESEMSPMNHFKIYVEDQIVFFTDGISEAINNNGEQFGIDRIKDFFSQSDIWKLSAQDAVNKFWKFHCDFCHYKELGDDTTLLLLRMKDKRVTTHINAQ